MDAQTVLFMEMAKMKIRTIPELSRRTGIKRTTAYERVNHPETMTVAELREIVRVTNMEDEQIAKIVRGK